MSDKTTGLSCHDADACAMGQKACPSPKACGCAEADERDTFQGDNAALSSCIRALLRLDAKGALYPHGIGGHARALLISADVRIASLEAQHQQELRAYDLTVQNLRAELVKEAGRTAEEKLRADQMTKQHGMQRAMRKDIEEKFTQQFYEDKHLREKVADLEAKPSAIGAGGVESLRKREQLTDEQIDAIQDRHMRIYPATPRRFARMIESAHGITNTKGE